MQGLFHVFIFNNAVTFRFMSQLEKRQVVCFLCNTQISDLGIKITFSLVLFLRAIECFFDNYLSRCFKLTSEVDFHTFPPKTESLKPGEIELRHSSVLS